MIDHWISENDGNVYLEQFCEHMWQEPYKESIFFDIKYFDYDDSAWKDYVIKETKLQKIIDKIIKNKN